MVAMNGLLPITTNFIKLSSVKYYFKSSLMNVSIDIRLIYSEKTKHFILLVFYKFRKGKPLNN